MCWHSSEKRLKLDDDELVDVIKSKLVEMDDRMSRVIVHWNDQSKGLHLDSNGMLVGETLVLVSSSSSFILKMSFSSMLS